MLGYHTSAICIAQPPSGKAIVVNSGMYESIVRRYGALLAGLDPLTDESRRRFGGQVRCGAGCDLCCHGLFDIGPLDALLLHHAWAALPAAERDAMADRAGGLLGRLAGIAPGWAYPHDLCDLDSDEAADRILETLGGVPCPVLAGANCSLYAARPFYCRVHGLKVRDSGGGEPIDTSCELNFTAGVPATAAWPAHDFSAQFSGESALLDEAGLDPDSRFLIPAVTTPRFGAWLAQLRQI